MGRQLKVTTWNVNSIKARNDSALSWLDRNRPDILCLQELKTREDAFPFDAFKALGYHAVVNGQQTYNGVAIVSKTEPTAVARGMGDNDPQARLISADIAGIRVVCAYVPNGAEVGSEKYAYKLEWLARFRDWLGPVVASGRDMIVAGDFNIAASEMDVHSPSRWEGTVIWNERMRDEFRLLRECGLVDTFRRVNPDAREYSWWDYRLAGFSRNHGLRIDYVMANPDLAGRASRAEIDRNERGVEKPSDHAPVTVEFELS